MSIDISAIADHKLTVVLVYDNETAERDLRLLPGIARLQEGKLLLQPFAQVEIFPIPDECYSSISPVSAELGGILGDAEYYVVIPVPPIPNDDDKITLQCITFD